MGLAFQATGQYLERVDRGLVKFVVAVCLQEWWAALAIFQAVRPAVFFLGHALGNAALHSDLRGLRFPVVVGGARTAQWHAAGLGDVGSMPCSVDDAQILALQPQGQAVQKSFNACTLQRGGGAGELAVFAQIAVQPGIKTSLRRPWHHGAAG